MIITIFLIAKKPQLLLPTSPEQKRTKTAEDKFKKKEIKI
jgi:hypothetical protein